MIERLLSIARFQYNNLNGSRNDEVVFLAEMFHYNKTKRKYKDLPRSKSIGKKEYGC